MGNADQGDPIYAMFRDLHRALVGPESRDETLARIAELGARTVPGCDLLSVSAPARGTRTVAHWGDDPDPLDQAQYDADAGPCLEAIRAVSRISIDDISRESRWPEFRAAALEQRVVGSLSLPLVAADQVLGSLNVYTRTSVGDDGTRVADLFAEQAAIALYNATMSSDLLDRSDDLRAALLTRDVIGQAKGILMYQRRITADQAFDVLRVASQRANRKLRDIAVEVAETGVLPDDGP